MRLGLADKSRGAEVGRKCSAPLPPPLPPPSVRAVLAGPFAWRGRLCRDKRAKDCPVFADLFLDGRISRFTARLRFGFEPAIEAVMEAGRQHHAASPSTSEEWARLLP